MNVNASVERVNQQGQVTQRFSLRFGCLPITYVPVEVDLVDEISPIVHQGTSMLEDFNTIGFAKNSTPLFQLLHWDTSE
jgi:hypothetical protein